MGRVRRGVLAAVLAAACPLSGCAERVTLMVLNETAAPMKCQVMFARWVERTTDPIPPDSPLVIAFQRQLEDGALFMFGDDGQRMMVENLFCGPEEEWWRQRRDIPLLPLRSQRGLEFAAICRMDQRFDCRGPVDVPQSRR